MTPQQKLVRLAEIGRELMSPRIGSQAKLVLTEERAQILADVHLPPPELMNLVEPTAWAKHMAATVAGLSEETALAWLSKAMEAAGNVGYTQGLLDGRKMAELGAQDGRAGLITALKVCLRQYRAGALGGPMVRDEADPDNPPKPLREYLVGVLRAAGEDVE